MSKPIHIVHLVYRFAAGGLENVLVQLINGLPQDAFRHTIIALTEADTSFVKRIERSDVEIVSLHKGPGQPFSLYPGMYRLLRRLKPDVMHTCNLAALEFMPVAALAGVPRRVHAEHGWDIADPNGSNKRYQFLRRVYKYFVQDFIAVSDQLYGYLSDVISIPKRRLHLIQNGVDILRFRPASPGDKVPDGMPFCSPDHYVIGTIGRLEPIKNQHLLVGAFIRLTQLGSTELDHLRLVLVGDGPLIEDLKLQVTQAGLQTRCWFAGKRQDIPELLRSFNCFVLPSLAEGTSCTLQEAMATACPIVATRVGGTPALLQDGTLGTLVPSDDIEAMAQALRAVINASDKEMTAKTAAGRAHVEEQYALPKVLKRYRNLFEG